MESIAPMQITKSYHVLIGIVMKSFVMQSFALLSLSQQSKSYTVMFCSVLFDVELFYKVLSLSFGCSWKDAALRYAVL